MAKTTDDTARARRAVFVGVREGESQDDASARTLTRPEVLAATVMQQLQGDNHEVNAVVRELERQVAAVRSGDLSRGEAMLVAQAHALDELFSSLARRGEACSYLDGKETYLRLAFKAQSQCRTTWQAVADIKHPRQVAYVQQANIANGPQQVNIGTARRQYASARAENPKKSTNELLPSQSIPEERPAEELASKQEMSP